MSNLQIFIEANNVLAEGKYDEFVSYLTEDIKWERVGERTLDGNAEDHKYISSAYNDLLFTTEKYISENEFVVEVGQIVSVKNGESKKRSYCDVWEFKDGLICNVTSFVI